MDADVFLSTAELAERVIGSANVFDRWTDDSALTGYTVAGLAGHLARAVLTVGSYLDRPLPPGEQRDAAGYFVHVLATHDPVSSDLHVAVRARSTEEAADGPAALAARLRDARLQLAGQLEEIDGGTRIAVLDQTVISVEDYLETRLVELVVHLDDLAVSVGQDLSSDIAPEAYATVASVLAKVAVARVGGLRTVRSLARRERHPDAVRAL